MLHAYIHIVSCSCRVMSADNLEKQQRNVTFYKRLGFNVVREAARELGGSNGCARSNAHITSMQIAGSRNSW